MRPSARLVVPSREAFTPPIARGFAGLGGGGLALAFRDFTGLHLGSPAGLFFGGSFAILFIAAAPALFFLTLAVETLFLETLVFGALERGLGLLLGFALPVDFFLLMAGLMFQYFPLDVGALAANFDVYGSTPALGTRELEFGLRLALQGDFARSGIALRFIVSMAAPQVGQQLVLGILADHVLGAVDFDARLIELLQQPIDRNLQNLRELSDRYVCHTCS